MAGFEVIVRPVVFPNIRPAPTRSLPPEDDPTKGFCVIKGSSGKVIDLPFSWNVSTSKQRPVETERRVDEVTVYQMEDNGTVNKKNFVKLDVANRITMAVPIAGVPIAGVPIAGATGSTGKPTTEKSNYARMKDDVNIEVRRRDVIKKNPDAPGAGTP